MWALLVAVIGTATAGDVTATGDHASVTITLTATVVRPVEVPVCDDHAVRNPWGCDAHHGRDDQHDRDDDHGSDDDHGKGRGQTDISAVPTSWVQPDGRAVTLTLALADPAPAVASAW